MSSRSKCKYTDIFAGHREKAGDEMNQEHPGAESSLLSFLVFFFLLSRNHPEGSCKQR